MQWFQRKSDDAGAGAAASAPPAGPAVPPPGAVDVPDAAADGRLAVDPQQLRAAVIDALRTVYDPEIPVDIYEIGLIYGLGVGPDGEVGIRMTLTSPMCPVAESLPIEVENRVAAVPGVTGVHLDLVWDPPWTPALMSEEARLLLNIG